MAGRSRPVTLTPMSPVSAVSVPRDNSQVPRIKSERIVGRREELALLGDLQGEAMAGAPAVVLISGDAGIGKTRLVTELIASAGDQARTLIGRCDALGDVVPVAAITDLFRQVASDTVDFPAARPALDAVLGGRGDSLSALELCEGVARIVEHLAARQPLVIVVEDLHWADASTRNVVGYLARRLASLPVLLLVTYRSDELHRRHPLRPFLAELHRTTHATHVELAALDRGEVAELAEAITGRLPGARILDDLLRLSGGNPFFVEELIAGRADTVPSNLREVVMARVSALGETERRLLRLASVGGLLVDPGVLARVADADPGWLQDRLRYLIDRHHLVVVGDEIAFRHALSQEVIYGELLPGERTALHRSYAAELQTLAPGRTGEIAHHLLLAGDHDSAFRASVAAGDDAARRGAQSEALKQYEQALDLWSTARADGVIDHQELVVRAAACAEGTRDFDRAIEMIERELVTAESSPTQVARLARILARNRWHANRSDVLAPLDQAAAAFEEPTPDAADLLLARSFFLTSAGRIQDALDAGMAALDMATELGDQARLDRSRESILAARLEWGDRARLEVAEDRLAGALASGDPAEIAVAGNSAGYAANRLGEFERTLTITDEAVAAARAAGIYFTRGVFVQFNQLRALERTGRWDQADHLATVLLDELGPFRHQWIDAIMMGIGPVWVRRGVDDPDDLLGRGYREVAGSGFLVEPLAQMAPPLLERMARRGDHEAARSIAGDTLDAVLPGAPIFAAEVVATAVMVEADRQRVLNAGGAPPGDSREMAADWVARLDQGLARMVQVPRWTAAFGRRARLELARLDRNDTAEEWATLADDWRSIGIPYEAAYASLRAAEAAMFGARPDRRRAAALLQAGYEIAGQLEATRLQDDIASLARHARVDVIAERSGPEPPAADRPRPDIVLTGREHDVLRLLVEGRSNGEIGKELFITTKTASTHVSAILRKLSASNRVEAATLAHRLGLVD
jgi:DNA-binding CsgD family transcriptional regulator/tetratricopeptide (TPR) repeat protein